MAGKSKLRTRSVAERLQYQAEFENLAAAEVRRMVDAFIEDRGVTQTEIAKSVGLDPSRLSKALYPSNVTLRTLSLIALACDREWVIRALQLDEAVEEHPSNYPPQPIVGPDDLYSVTNSPSASDRKWQVAIPGSGAHLVEESTSTIAEFRQ